MLKEIRKSFRNLMDTTELSDDAKRVASSIFDEWVKDNLMEVYEVHYVPSEFENQRYGGDIRRDIVKELPKRVSKASGKYGWNTLEPVPSKINLEKERSPDMNIETRRRFTMIVCNLPKLMEK